MPAKALTSTTKIAWISALCFLIALFLGSINNDFPFYYHVDEPGKARQILTGERNLHHPLLMLNTVDVFTKSIPQWRDPQHITEIGRWSSALYSAGAVAILTFLLGTYLGATVAWIGGFIAATHWNIFELSHYFKEDPALSFGVMASFLGLHFVLTRASLLSSAFFGLTLALAASGKYIGILALLLVPVAYWRSSLSPSKLALHLVTLALSFACVFAIINWQMFVQPDTLQASLNKETKGVLEGGQIATHSFFHFGFFNRFYQVARVAAIPGILFFLALGIPKLKNQSRVIISLVIFPLLLATILGFSQKDSGRYYLPAVYGVCAMAALGWKLWFDWLKIHTSKSWTKWVTILFLLLTLGGAVERLKDYYVGFNQGSRETLSKWIATHLPSEATIAQSYATKLADPKLEERGHRKALFPQRLITLKDLQEKHTLEDLKGMGVTHLAATEPEWKTFLKQGKVRKDKSEKFASSRSFWKSIWDHATVVWETDAGKVGTHNPPMKLWELPNP